MKKLFTLLSAITITNLCIAQSGSLDLSFDLDGIVTTSLSFNTPNTDQGNAIAIQSDGKILVAGYSYFSANNNDFSVMRYNTNGSLDNTFDTDGRVSTTFGIGTNDQATCIAIQSDGKIVVGGYSNQGGNYDFAVVRYNTNGSLDNTFDTDGRVTTVIGADHDYVRGIAIQSDGKIVVTGDYYVGINNDDIAVVRYNTDGSLDATFGTSGKVTTIMGSDLDGAKSVAIQSDGKIVVGGFSIVGSTQDFAVLRYNTNGSLDVTFDGDGMAITPIGTGDDSGSSVALQSDGKIVLGGESVVGSNDNFAAIRYNTNGSLDATFDGDGKVTTAFGTADDKAKSVAILSDGRIVLAGNSNNGTNNDFAVAVYNSNGSLDVSFDTDGKVTTAIGSGADVGSAVAVQSDSKIVVAGYFNNGSNNDFAVARYNNLPTNINSITSDNYNLIVYPNPAINTLNISLKNTSQEVNSVTITDFLGKEVSRSFAKNGNDLIVSVDDLCAGIYMLNVKTNTTSISKKIIITK
ncbi:MAG: T9SS type A sorting domain-containing protein [Bacteroidia bacterium]|nr:T9SS type A sorting domain-containing protein [Bacteroidia bacterium]